MLAQVWRCVLVVLLTTTCSSKEEPSPHPTDAQASPPAGTRAGQPVDRAPSTTIKAPTPPAYSPKPSESATPQNGASNAYPCGGDPRSLSQMGMNACAALKAKESEAEVDATLREIERRRAGEPQLLSALRHAQEEWSRFRDAELKALFPESAKQVAYGSMYGMCYQQQRLRLALSRRAQLRLWLDGDPDARGCSGAVSEAVPP